MNILWFTWKDINHPAAGGAEVVTDQLASMLARDGHEVRIITAGYPGATDKSAIHGYTVYRTGNKWTLYYRAMRLYQKKFEHWPDLIIEEINTFPFFTQYYTTQKRVLYIFQLCREIWFHELFFPLNRIGHILEPIYLRFLNRSIVFTESESTKTDLARYGFDRRKIEVIPIALERMPAISTIKKNSAKPILISVGSIRSMKQTMDQIKAFEIVKELIPNLTMILAGKAEGTYGKRVLEYIAKSPYRSDISYLGRVSPKQKYSLMNKGTVISVTSVKEGWGLIVTEAGYFGTPAVVYDTDGLRDSVVHDVTGFVVKHNTPRDLAEAIRMVLKDPKRYAKYSGFARKYSLEFTPRRSYNTFLKALKKHTLI